MTSTDRILGIGHFMTKSAGSHKYISRKPDGKGGWTYTYSGSTGAAQGAARHAAKLSHNADSMSAADPGPASAEHNRLAAKAHHQAANAHQRIASGHDSATTGADKKTHGKLAHEHRRAAYIHLSRVYHEAAGEADRATAAVGTGDKTSSRRMHAAADLHDKAAMAAQDAIAPPAFNSGPSRSTVMHHEAAAKKLRAMAEITSRG